MTGKRNRTKGHNLERDIASALRTIGYEFARTTRSESKTLDDCGVDISNVPYLIQCKSGYDNRYPRYPEIHNSVRQNISEKYDKNSLLRMFPVVLVHKPTRDVTYWSFDQETALELLRIQKVNTDILEEVLEVMQKAKNEILSLEEALANTVENVDEDDDLIIETTTLPNNQVYDNLYDTINRIKTLLK